MIRMVFTAAMVLWTSLAWSTEDKVDCASRLSIGLEEGEIVLPIVDLTKHVSETDMVRLGDIACAMVSRSVEEGVARGRDVQVLKSLPIFVKSTDVDGALYAAPNMPGVGGSGEMWIQAEYLKKDRNVFMFLIAHELGHATLGHNQRKVAAKIARVVGSVAVAAGTTAVLVPKRPKRGLVAGVTTGIATFTATKCLLGAMGLRHEFAADDFGVRALAREVGLEPAKAAAIELFTQHDLAGQGCMEGADAHPSSKDRRNRVKLMLERKS